MDQTTLVIIAFIVLCIIGGIAQEVTGDTDIFNRDTRDKGGQEE